MNGEFPDPRCTQVEYEHLDRIGHELAVSAEHDPVHNIPPTVVIGMHNLVTDAAGYEQPDIWLTAAGARDLAASLLLAADHLDGDWRNP